MLTIQGLLQQLFTRNQMIRERESRISELEIELEKKQQEVDCLKRALYGRKSEKMKIPEASPLPMFPDFDPGIEVIDNTSLNIEPDEVIDAIEEESRQRRQREKAQRRKKRNNERRMARISWLTRYSPWQALSKYQRNTVKEERDVSYSTQLASECLKLGVKRFSRRIGCP